MVLYECTPHCPGSVMSAVLASKRSILMYRLPLLCLGLALSQCVMCSSIGDEARRSFEIVATASSTTTGLDVVLLHTPLSEVRARSITFKNDRDRITLTAHDNELELRCGSIVIRTNELRLPATLQIEDFQLRELKLQPRGPKPVANPSKQ